MKTVILKLDPDLYQALKIRAAQEGRPYAHILREWIKEKLGWK